MLFIWIIVYCTLGILCRVVYFFHLPAGMGTIVSSVMSIPMVLSFLILPFLFRKKLFKILSFIILGIVVTWSIIGSISTIIAVVKFL